jgi:hypothetical protein
VRKLITAGIVIGSIVLVVLILIGINSIPRPMPRLKADDYSSVSIQTWEVNRQQSTDRREIELVVNFLNSIESYTQLRWVDGQISPYMGFALHRKDGGVDGIEAYGAAWEPGSFIWVNYGKQYFIRDKDKFLESLEELMRALNSLSSG